MVRMIRNPETILTGAVWSLGAKPIWDGTCQYLQFVLKQRGTARDLERTPIRIWVHWYGGDFMPRPHDKLRVTGTLMATKIQERMDKTPRLNLVLLAATVEIIQKKGAAK